MAVGAAAAAAGAATADDAVVVLSAGRMGDTSMSEISEECSASMLAPAAAAAAALGDLPPPAPFFLDGEKRLAVAWSIFLIPPFCLFLGEREEVEDGLPLVLLVLLELVDPSSCLRP